MLYFLEAEVPVFALVPLSHPLLHLCRSLWRWHNHLIARLPVCRCRNLELVSCLECLDQPDYLGHESSVLEGVVDHRPHDSFVIDEKDTADCRR